MFSRIVRWGLGPALCIAILACDSRTARAGITFDVGNHPQADEENVLLGNGTTGSTVYGETNQSGITVSFSSTTDTLTEPASGQARVAATDGLLNNITIAVPGGSFTDLILNPFNGDGTAMLTAVVNKVGGGTYTSTYSYSLGNGQNFITVVATGGEMIQSLTIDAAAGFSDLRQPRISGAAVPEPASVAMGAVAIGLLGLTHLRGRSRTA